MNRVIKFINYAMPLMCIANALLATSTDTQTAWFIATLGWGAHLVEVRKNGN